MDGAGDQLALSSSGQRSRASANLCASAVGECGAATCRSTKSPMRSSGRQSVLLDQLLAQREGLKHYEGRCVGCGKVISMKAPHCNRRWCSAVWKGWSRDQRRVVREALKSASPIIILTDVTLPGAWPTAAGRARGRRNYLPWASVSARVVDPRALYRAKSRFKKRLGWLKRQAYNDGRAALSAVGFATDRISACAGLRSRATETRSTARTPSARLHQRGGSRVRACPSLTIR